MEQVQVRTRLIVLFGFKVFFRKDMLQACQLQNNYSRLPFFLRHNYLSIQLGDNIFLQNILKVYQDVTFSKGLWLDWMNESKEGSGSKPLPKILEIHDFKNLRKGMGGDRIILSVWLGYFAQEALTIMVTIYCKTPTRFSETHTQSSVKYSIATYKCIIL